MNISSIKTGAAVLVTTTAVAMGLAVSSATAATPGQVCNTIAAVTVSVPLGTNYTLPAGAGFRIVDYASGDRYYGHGNGKADGYIPRSVINQSTCS